MSTAILGSESESWLVHLPRLVYRYRALVLVLVERDLKTRYKGSILGFLWSFANPLLSFGEEGTGAGMLNDPRSVGVDRSGNIYVGDYSDGRIQIFDAQGNFQTSVRMKEGDNQIQITADDVAGNTQEKSIKVTYEKD